MIETTFIDCFGAQLEVPVFLKDLWPHELPLDSWPTFCGAGSGAGDAIVPDHLMFGDFIANPACFIHDICFAICEATRAGFEWCNEIFLRNLRVLAKAQLNWFRKFGGYLIANIYYSAVNTVGWLCFKSSPVDTMIFANPLDHPVVKDRLHRLACASFGIPVPRGANAA